MRSNSKDIWLDLLSNHHNKMIILTIFCKNYYYFSLHQIRAFTRIIKLFPADDCRSLALIASVVYDELGNGIFQKSHSNLFKKFALSVDSNMNLSFPDGQIALGVKKYVRILWDSFDGDSLPKALAAYVFLEETAVDFYPPILEILKSFPFITNEDLEFFYIHATLEVEHEKAANELVMQMKFSLEEQQIYYSQILNLNNYWEGFWHDILFETITVLNEIKTKNHMV